MPNNKKTYFGILQSQLCCRYTIPQSLMCKRLMKSLRQPVRPFFVPAVSRVNVQAKALARLADALTIFQAILTRCGGRYNGSERAFRRLPLVARRAA